MAILSGSSDAARAHLAEAKRWIDRGWKVHAPEHAELTARVTGEDTRDDHAAPAAMATRPTPTGNREPKRRWWGLLG